MNMRKELTIIIPVYNAQEHIRRCLDSVVCQIKKSYELLLINDGSNDKSLDVLKKYEFEYPDIIRVIDKSNEGVAETRNLGIREAKGEYICFVDDDDDVAEDYFASFLDEIRDTEYDLVIGGYKRTENNRVRYKVSPVSSLWYKFTVLAPWAKIYRKSFLIENNIRFLDYKSGEDIYFSLSIYAKTDRIKVIPYNGYHWYFNNESVSNTVQQGFHKDIDIVYLMNQFYSVGKKKDVSFQFFYVRYLIWYLLFAGRRAKKDSFLMEYQKILSWLKEKEIPLRFPLCSESTRGERWSVKIVIGGFITISRLHLMKVFATIFCRV